MPIGKTSDDMIPLFRPGQAEIVSNVLDGQFLHAGQGRRDFLTTTLVDNLQSGHGWTKQTSEGTQADDTVDFVKGSQSLKITTDGDGATVRSRVDGINPVVNMTGKVFVLWVRSSSLSSENLLDCKFVASSDDLVANYWVWDLTDVFRNDKTVFVPITLSFSDATVYETPNRASINALQIQATDKNGTVIQVNLGGIHSAPEASAGVCTLTFDDGYASQYATARPILDAHGFRGTAYIYPDAIDTFGYMTLNQLRSLQDNSGWDISAHHDVNFTTETRVEEWMKYIKRYLIENGLTKGANELSWPNGAWDADTMTLARRYFRSARAGYRLADHPDAIDPMRLRVYDISQNVTTAAVETAVTNAIANKDWLILLFHKIVTTPSEDIEYSTANFTTIIDDINTQGISVKPISEVLNS